MVMAAATLLPFLPVVLATVPTDVLIKKLSMLLM
jgi:hypothetical protein